MLKVIRDRVRVLLVVGRPSWDVRFLRQLVPDGVHVQVDGGVGPDNVRALHDAGADLLVAGTSIFGQEDLPRAYRGLVQAVA